MATVMHRKVNAMARKQGEGKLHKYYAEEDHARFLRDVVDNAPTVSPGGVTQLLKCSREFVHQLIEAEQVETWVEYSGFLRRRASQIEVSVLDVVRYGLKSGRITKHSILGLCLDRDPKVRELLDNYQGDAI